MLFSSRFPTLLQCWNDGKLDNIEYVGKQNIFSPESLERLKDGKIFINVGTAGSGMSGGPVFCNEDQKVCAIATNLTHWDQQFKGDESFVRSALPPLTLRAIPLSNFRETLEGFAELKKRICK